MAAAPVRLDALIGATPLVELQHLSPKPGVRLLAKLEGQNPSGSIKDRVALALLDEAEANGKLKPGGTVIEASSGNTGIALATLARQRGYAAKIVMPRHVPPSIPELLSLLGADVIYCDSVAGMKGAMDRAKDLADANGWFALGQFTSRLNVEAHYRTTGTEIANAAPNAAVFVAGIGTGGTIMGVGRRLRETSPKVRIIGVEPRHGEHLQGLVDVEEAFAPPLLNLDELNGRIMVDNAAAIRATERLIGQEGLLAGISGGACLHAALRVAETMERGDIVFMCSDGAWKYIPARPWDAARADDHSLDNIHWW